MSAASTPSKHAAGLAQLGSIALSSAGLGFLFTRCLEVVRDQLHADCAEIHKSNDDGMPIVGRAGFSEGADAIEIRQTLAQQAIASEDGIAVAAGDKPRSVSGIGVVIAGTDGQRWGVITVWLPEPRPLATGEIDFLRSVSNLLGQAIERRRAEVQLQIRAVQQGALAELGRLTLSGISDATLARVCELVMDSLSVEHAYMFRPEGESLVVAAGEDPPLPVAFEHAAEVARAPQTLTLNRGNVSGIATPVRAGSRNFGVICGYTTVAKTFTESDVQFMESVALVLAEAADRDAARAELSESERRYRSVVEGASEIIFSLAPSGEFRSLNPAFEVITGWKVEEWLGRSFIELVAEEQREEKIAIFKSVLEHPRHVRLHVRLIGKTRPVLVDVASSPRVVAGEVVEIYGFARDVTEEQRLQVKLEQANRLSSLGRLAATVAHEFNNVLMGISPFTELLRRESLSANAVAALDQIAHSVRRGKRTTEDILRFAQPAEPAMATLAVDTLLDSIAMEARSLVGPDYTIEVRASDGIEIAGDSHQLHQAFVNLILNARDAMPDGGTIVLGARPEGPNAHFTVADHGTGIRADTLDHIFEPLFTTKKNGTGLGLPVARQVVTRHGGDITVQSDIGQGTTFHLFLPLATEARVDEVAPSTSGRRRCRSVLLVEDEVPVATGIAALLELEGVDVRTVATGRAVLPAIAQSRPDAVVLDIGLPDMDGTTVYEAIAAAHPDLPVVFSSGHGDATKLERYLTRPNVRFLLKPYEIDDLLQMLDRAVS